jgi:hypothetical protein
MQHPYQHLPHKAYWRTAVSDLNPLETVDIYSPKKRIAQDDGVVTFGSCFAQHISSALKKRGFTWLDCEPAPSFVSDQLRRKFNYGVFSARTGNIYSAKALLQWIKWSLEIEPVPVEIWSDGDRHFDPFRPSIEVEGFASVEELLRARVRTLDAFRSCIESADVFVFTLGLTESWEEADRGYTYATCPGTNAGQFNSERHVFRNYTHGEVYSHLSEALRLIFQANNSVRILLTVSPVPLTATASGDHVVVATSYSKSVLRSVAGQLRDEWEQVDYFPSYEIITSPNFRGMFFNPNMRTVSERGVDFVMSHFMQTLCVPHSTRAVPGRVEVLRDPVDELSDVKCEEAILEAFAVRPMGG